jgi:hypothetical protein
VCIDWSQKTLIFIEMHGTTTTKTNIYCCVIDWISYYITAKHNGMAPIKGKDFARIRAECWRRLHLKAKIMVYEAIQLKMVFSCPSHGGMWGRKTISPLILKLGIREQEAVNFRPRQLYPRKNNHGEIWIVDSNGPTAVWTLRKEEKIFVPPGIRASDCPPRRPSH